MKYEYCVEHDNPKPCIRCALLCGCGCSELREGVTEEDWQAALTVEPILKAHAHRDEETNHHM